MIYAMKLMKSTRLIQLWELESDSLLIALHLLVLWFLLLFLKEKWWT